MKAFRSTGILFLLVAALAAYTFYEYRNAEKDADLDLGEVAAFEMKREDIGSIKLVLKGIEIDLVKNGDQWQMQKPVQDWAENASVDGFLLSLLSQKLKAPHGDEEQKNIEWSTFGLEAAPATIEISGKGKTERLQVSEKTAYDGSYFARRGDQLFLGDPAFNQIMARSPASFRSRKLWREPETTQIESVRVELATDGMRPTAFQIKKSGDTWALEPKPGFDTDAEKLAAWIERVKDLMPNDFIQESVSEADKKTFLLSKPSLKVDMKLKRADGQEAHWSVLLGQDKGEDVYLTTGQASTVYKTSKSGLAQLRVNEAFFRNGNKPFAVDVEKAREVEIVTDRWHHTFVKEESSWSLKDELKDLEFDQDKLVGLMQNIRSLEATEFFPPAKSAKTRTRVKIRDAQGAEIFALAWGDEFRPEKPWNQGFKYEFVKTSLEKDILGVQKEKLDRLIDEGIVKKKVEAKSSTKPETK